MNKRILLMMAIVLTTITAAACASRNGPEGNVPSASPADTLSASPTDTSSVLPANMPPSSPATSPVDTPANGKEDANTAEANAKSTPTPATGANEPDAVSTTLANFPPDLAPAFPGLWPKIDGSTATAPLTEALHDYLGGIGSVPVHWSTPNAYENLIRKAADIIFVTAPSENELMRAEEAGIGLEIIPIVKDALVFLVNTDNPVENVTLPKLRGTYTGKITSWKEWGGTDEAIIPYQRVPDAGSQSLMLKLLMNGQKPMPAPTEWAISDMDQLVQIISDYDHSRNALGYSVFYYVNNMYGNSRFKLLGIDGVKPTRDTITSGEYPLTDYYYAVIRKDTPADSPVRKLIDWFLSDEGQTLAIRAGYIPLRPIAGILPEDGIDPVYLGETEASAGTGGTQYKGFEQSTELVTGSVRKPLSDVFYDGFNYIEYINREITRQIFAQSEVGPGEDRTKRSFPGIPKDYPHYELYDGYQLCINFPADNPFFINAESFCIPLTPEISPYGTQLGGYTASLYRAENLLPEAELMAYRIEITDSPDVTRRINEQLKTWTDGFSDDEDAMKLLTDFSREMWDPYRFTPYVGRYKNLLSVTYYLDVYDVGYYNPMLYSICFDITTGAVINPLDWLPAKLPYEKAGILANNVFTDSYDNSDLLATELLENYTPAAGFVIENAWFHGNNCLCLDIIEPSGRRLQVMFDSDWEEF